MKPLRCAIYTRKSTDEGLEQEFNSLDAQRASCEAFILSQAGEGWSLLPHHFDDGGWSGGNMERPALKSLLKAISEGRIDVVVVYKVDRLTRSLMDFARIVEQFDAHGVSFVSVTQAFNTTSSMGRLTLNVLLSFAQFEREVTGERIRDKIAASKARGIWMGGNLPLGYDVKDRKLFIVEEEAELVRHIYKRYQELGSVLPLVKELDASGHRTKRWTSSKGNVLGGCRFSCGAIYHILGNRIYLGEIVHKGKAHKGEHPAIIDPELFNAVQTKLSANRVKRVKRKEKATASPLTGKLFDADRHRTAITAKVCAYLLRGWKMFWALLCCRYCKPVVMPKLYSKPLLASALKAHNSGLGSKCPHCGVRTRSTMMFSTVRSRSMRQLRSTGII